MQSSRASVLSLAAGCFAGLLSSCGAPESAPSSLRQAVVVGADDRIEPFEAPPALRGAAEPSTVALLFAHHVMLRPESKAVLRARSAGEELGLCATERFAEQPSAAFCSGVLIDDDLVMTAGHCLLDDPTRCRQTRFVFGFSYRAHGALLELDGDDVYMCKRIVASQRSDGSDDGRDFAVVQLDRAVSGIAHPATIAETPATVGSRLALASHGAGLPLKLEAAAEVVDASPDRALFIAATDTVAGSSGGPLFDDEFKVVGIVKGGDLDFEDVGGCKRSTHVEASRERHQQAFPIRAVICESGWPSERLCGTDARCGDDICSAGETSQTCERDCPASLCGDGMCDLGERGTCAVDCNAHDDVPLTWPLSPETYWVAHPRSEAEPSTAGCELRSRAGSAMGWPVLVMGGLSLAAIWTTRRRRCGP